MSGHAVAVSLIRHLAKPSRCATVTFHSDYLTARADTLTLWIMHTDALAAAQTTPHILRCLPPSHPARAT